MQNEIVSRSDSHCSSDNYSELPEVLLPRSGQTMRHHERQNRRLYRLALNAFRRRVQMLCRTATVYRESVQLLRGALKNTYDTEIRLLRLVRRTYPTMNDLSSRWTNELLKNTKEQAINHLLGVTTTLKQVGQVTELLLRVFQDHLLQDVRSCPLEVVLEFARVTDYFNTNRRILEEVTRAISKPDRHFCQSYLFSVQELGQLLFTAARYKPKYIDGYDEVIYF